MILSSPAIPAHVRQTGDQMAVCLAREIRDGERVFHGVNSPLPVTAIFLARRLHAPRCVLVEVAGSVDPQPRSLPRSTNAAELCHGAASLFSNADIYDLFARGGIDLVFLGGAQIDRQGHVNMSYIGNPASPKVRLPGGGGGAVIMAQAGRTVVWRTVHDKRTFVPRVDFVTQAGNLSAVVTPMAVLRLRSGKLDIDSVHPGHTPAAVADATGFPLDLDREIPTTTPPSEEELEALREIDPNGIRYSEFKVA